jgi:hypothetical protein
MNELEPPPRLRPSRLRPILGTVAGAAAGFAFYIFFGCDSG